MSITEWWEPNGKYVKAWVCHNAAMIVPFFVIRFAFKHFPLFETSGAAPSCWTPAVVAYVSVSILVYGAVSLFLFRLFVLKFIIRQEAWAAAVQNHPYRPYVAGWLIYIIVCIGIADLMGILLGALFAAFPWGGYTLRTLITFFVFRMAVRKHVLPRTCGAQPDLPRENG